ncbi:MAG: hypothetical protein HY318_00860, partial [Armatimonadetes bacterium]|nr:hypothetical protein [Armatimonadota bacterium]
MLFTRNFVLFFAGGCGLFALHWVNPSLQWVAWLYDGALLLLAILDYQLTPRPEQLTVSRQVTDLQPRDDLLTRSKVAGHGPEKLSLGVNNRISLHLR